MSFFFVGFLKNKMGENSNKKTKKKGVNTTLTPPLTPLTCDEIRKRLEKVCLPTLVPLIEEQDAERKRRGCNDSSLNNLTEKKSYKCSKIEEQIVDEKKIHDRRFKYLVGVEEIQNKIETGFIQPFVHPCLFPESVKAILLHGPPGTGKTTLAQTAANEFRTRSENMDVLFFEPTGASLNSKWVGETEANVAKLFDCANKLALKRKKETGKQVYSFLFFDEFEVLVPRDGNENTVNMFLTTMDGINSYPNVIIIAATNAELEKLKPSILNRFAYKIFVPLPKKENIEDLIKLELVTKFSTIVDNDANLAEDMRRGFEKYFVEIKHFFNITDEDISVISKSLDFTSKYASYSHREIKTIMGKVFFESAQEAEKEEVFKLLHLNKNKIVSDPVRKSVLDALNGYVIGVSTFNEIEKRFGEFIDDDKIVPEIINSKNPSTIKTDDDNTEYSKYVDWHETYPALMESKQKFWKKLNIYLARSNKYALYNTTTVKIGGGTKCEVRCVCAGTLSQKDVQNYLEKSRDSKNRLLNFFENPHIFVKQNEKIKLWVSVDKNDWEMREGILQNNMLELFETDKKIVDIPYQNPKQNPPTATSLFQHFFPRPQTRSSTTGKQESETTRSQITIINEDKNTEDKYISFFIKDIQKIIKEILEKSPRGITMDEYNQMETQD
jgi:SpoVK/Ycf46/Vps4 family AAA+-type ATPase